MSGARRPSPRAAIDANMLRAALARLRRTDGVLRGHARHNASTIAASCFFTGTVANGSGTEAPINSAPPASAGTGSNGADSISASIVGGVVLRRAYAPRIAPLSKSAGRQKVKVVPDSFALRVVCVTADASVTGLWSTLLVRNPVARLASVRGRRGAAT